MHTRRPGQQPCLHGALVLLGTCAVAAFLLNFHLASASALEGIEEKIKSAMIVNFIRFVKWPAEDQAQSGGHLVVGVMGADPIAAVLKTQEGRIIDGKSLSIRRVERLEDICQCHVVFVGSPHPWRDDEVLAAAKNAPVLTIGDSAEFCRNGGMIRLFREKNNIRFEINHIAATQSRLQVSAKLLEIATAVIR